MSIRRHRWFILGLCAVIFIVACDRGTYLSNRAPDSLSDRPSHSASCHVVEHDGGETEICSQPQTVVALSPRALDVIRSYAVEEKMR